MTTWTRARVATFCGNCRTLIAIGAPLREYQCGTVRRVKVRCPACADEPVPEDLPLEVIAPPVVGPRASLDVSRLGLLALDFSARRLGERDPGEEG